MNEEQSVAPRILVGAVTHAKSPTLEAITQAVCEDVKAAGFTLVRSVTVNCEEEVVQQLVSRVSNDNEADAIILVGGTGFGPRDHVCEAIDKYVERRIEGFGEAYRHLLRRDEGGGDALLGGHAWLVRATAGVYNQCLVFALTGRKQDVQHAMREILVPTLSEAVQLATGKLRAVKLRA